MIAVSLDSFSSHTINWQQRDAGPLNTLSAAKASGMNLNLKHENVDFDLCNIPGIWVCDFIKMFGETRYQVATNHSLDMTLNTIP